MKIEDSRTYITDRVQGLLDLARQKYRVFETQASHFLDVKFDQSIVFEHEDGKFKIIEWGDRDNPDKMECSDIIRHPDCQYVLKCQYNSQWRVPKLRPFFYFEKTKPKEFSDSLEKLRSLPKTTNKLYWRGNDHLGRRDVLNSLNDVLNDGHTNRVSLQEYYEEIAAHRVALSLPGLGKSCHREYECFAIGTVVISPKFQNTNHAPLIPDHHYLAVDDPAQIRDKIAMTTQLELCAIRLNAMKYYDEYLRYENSLKWLWHLLEL